MPKQAYGESADNWEFERMIRIPSEYGDLYFKVVHQWGPIQHLSRKLQAEVKRQVEEKIVSVAQLSRGSGLSRNTLSKYIRGSKIRSMDKCSKLSTFLGLDDFLFSDWPRYGPYVEGVFERQVGQTNTDGERTQEIRRKWEVSRKFWDAVK